MKKQRDNKGQAMVEYIIIVVLIAVTLIVLFTRFGRGVAGLLTGATNAISETEGQKAKEYYDDLGEDNNVKSFNPDGTFK
ncbi:MAG: hypothetical protein FWF96_04530 [Kiritimatiellaeota bacterium]|nr:hypothetical protein [Kiritimatiellota bacterium]